MKTPLAVAATLMCWLFTIAPPVRGAEMPGPTVPDGLGVHIHFTAPRPGELDMLAETGFRWVRRGLSWRHTEREPGVYDFSEFDRLLDALDARDMRAMLFFSYTNPLYDQGRSVDTDEGRRAFVRWALAAVRRYRNRGVLWEMYNEPNNVMFWRPKVEPEQYVRLALAVGEAIRQSEPQETYIGPATSTIDFPFLEQCFEAGLLDYWSAVTVHPYRETFPETVAPEYAQLRRLVGQYAPRGKDIAIISGEWGYPSVWPGDASNETIQAKAVPRLLLTNLAEGIPLSIWYVWRDNGDDPDDPEHHFGLVRHAYEPNRSPVCEPKPAHAAAKTLIHTLRGYRFRNRLDAGDEDDYVLAFERGEDDIRIAAWTKTGTRSRRIPVAQGRYQVVDYLGQRLATLSADAEGLLIELTDAPQYLLGEPGRTDIVEKAESEPACR